MVAAFVLLIGSEYAWMGIAPMLFENKGVSQVFGKQAFRNLTAPMAEWYRASTSGAVDLGLIPSRVKPMTSKLVFTASLLDVQH